MAVRLRLDRRAMPMLLKENGTAGRRERSQLNEKNRRANESSLIVKSFVGAMTL